MTAKVREGDFLSRRFTAAFPSVEIIFWDERLSTVAAEKFLIGTADVSRAKRRKIIDKMAAAYILQGYLDSKS